MSDQEFRQIEEAVAPPPRVLLLRRSGRHLGLVVGTVVFVAIALMALLAPWIAPYDPYAQSLGNRLVPPIWMDGGTWAHALGTDHLGRDYLSRIMYGARISLLIGVSAALLSGVIGILLGVSAGYFGGKVDMVVMFIITSRLAMPVILVALAVVALFGSSVQIVIIVLGLLLWDRYAIVMRASTLQIRQMDYVQAARAQGCSVPWLLLSEVMPNLLNNLIVIATLEMAHAIILEAALSFLGLGVQPPLPSWGLMVSEGKDYILFDPWIIAIPGAFLFVLVLAINLMGDGIRDVTAPDSRN